ncbi:GntR family transcriptional regulator [Ferviditalea candida]|uniref:GntR family transcriptional regulator n=1 Tax=Ferviditalea candida TaxID=3108399 RepID=A0ABU5ZG67_9BACL|nr:GntR family transcriptional regulator [Paenibacillaceae bacterium T2]
MTSKRQFTGDIIYNQLKKMIIEWEYEPEQMISEEMLTNKLGVSRTPLRQALYRLELEGLVVRQSNGRMHVAPISIHEAQEIFKVREVLEGLIAREATKNITKEQLARMEDTLELMDRAAQDNRKFDALRYGSEFHHYLYEPSQNQTAVHFLSQLNSRLERYRRLGGYKNPKYLPMLPVKEHKDIFEAIATGNADLAEQAMRAHIKRSLNVTIETLQMSSSGL